MWEFYDDDEEGEPELIDACPDCGEYAFYWGECDACGYEEEIDGDDY